jgi:hypothetical protein
VEDAEAVEEPFDLACRCREGLLRALVADEQNAVVAEEWWAVPVDLVLTCSAR